MSKELVEDIHYYHSQTAKKFKAYDIIDAGKVISILEGNEKGLSTWQIYNKKSKDKIRKLIGGIISEKTNGEV